MKNEKKQDLNRLDQNAKAEISEGDTKELKNVMELEEKKPPDKTIFSNNQKKAGEAMKFEMVGNLEGKIQEKKLPDKTVHITNKEKAKKDKTKIEAKLKNGKKQDLDRLNVLRTESEQNSELEESIFGTNKEKAGEAEEFEKVGNPKGKIQEEKKLPDKTVSNANKEKAGKAEEFEKASNLKRKMLVFGENKIEAEDNVTNYNGRLDYKDKVLEFVKNKIEAGLKDVIKMKKSLVFGKNKIEHNVIDYNGRLNCNGKVLGFVMNKIEAKLKDMMKLKEKKLLVFDENKIDAEHNVINYSDMLDCNGKVLGFVKNKIEAELKDMMKLKKLLVFGENKIEAKHNVIDYNGRLDYSGKVLGFVKNKIEAELKDMMKLKEKKLLVFDYNGKVLGFMKNEIESEECIKENKVEIVWVKGDKMLGDCLTKTDGLMDVITSGILPSIK